MECYYCKTIASLDAIYCGNCGKILIRALGRLDSNCPYCFAEFEYRPLAKTRCKNCKNQVYSRIRPIDEIKVLLTETEKDQIEIQWATLKNNLEYYLAEKEAKNKIYAQLKTELSREPLKKEIHKKYVMGNISEARRQTLIRYQQDADIIRSWEWVTSKQIRSCIYCIAMDGKQFSLNTSFDSLDHCENEYCRCSMIPVIKDFEVRKRTIGAEWFRNLTDSEQKEMLGATRFNKYRNEKSLDEILGLHHLPSL